MSLTCLLFLCLSLVAFPFPLSSLSMRRTSTFLASAASSSSPATASSSSRIVTSSLLQLLDASKPNNSTLISVDHDLLAKLGLLKSDNDEEYAWLDVVSGNGGKDESWPFASFLPFERDHNVLCLHRWKIWWAIPRLLKSEAAETAAPAETYLLLGKMKKKTAEEEVADRYLLLLPLVDKHMGFSLEGTFSGSASAFMSINGHDNTPSSIWHAPEIGETRRAVLVSVGGDPLELVANSMRLLKEHLRQGLDQETLAKREAVLQQQQQQEQEQVGGRKGRFQWPRGSGPKFIDNFGWCTWDSFYTDLTHPRVLAGLSSFASSTVTPRFLILDDGWQDTNVDDRANGKQWGGRLTSFHANYKFALGFDGTSAAGQEEAVAPDDEKLPGSVGQDMKSLQSLSHLVQASKSSEHHIEHFLVWHTISGYWAGVDIKEQEEEQVAHLARYDAQVTFPKIPEAVRRMSVADAFSKEPFVLDGVGLVHPEQASSFFAHYHEQLASFGVDGVKVDAQSVLYLLNDEKRGGGWSLSKTFHSALQASVQQNFGGGAGFEFPVIHCMAHSQGLLFAIAALYPDTGQQVPVVRGSDDFWPLLDESHGPHLFANALNSLLMSHIGLHDWDMFQTSLGHSSRMHAAARAISGGPVYVSDKPEEHDEALLRRMAFRDGALPRCIRNARPTIRSLFLDPQLDIGVPLLLQNVNPAQGLVIGAFNVAGSVLENDKDMFRFARPEEMVWKHNGAREQVLAWQSSTAENEQKKGAAWFLREEWARHLGISWSVQAADVEEAKSILHQQQQQQQQQQQTCTTSPTFCSGTTGWIAYRLSDRALFHAPLNASIPISLARVFDFEIIAFAKMIEVADQLKAPKWIGVIGAIDMLNPGGAVLAVSTSSSETSGADKGVVVNLDLLGEGRFWIVAQGASCEAFLVSAGPLEGDAAALPIRVEVSTRTYSIKRENNKEAEEEEVCVVELRIARKKRAVGAKQGVQQGVHVSLRIQETQLF